MSTICLVLCRLSGWLRLSPCWDMEGPKGCVALRTNAQEKSTAQFVAAGATDASSSGSRRYTGGEGDLVFCFGQV
jgi:hypothetical protein